MFGGKIFLTYKRRRLSSGTVGNGCHSEGPKKPLSVTSDKHDEFIDEQASETSKISSTTSLECVLCGLKGNLEHCEDCHRPYHLLCLNQLHKHCFRGRRLHCGCIKTYSLTPRSVRKSSRLKAKLEGSNAGVHSPKLHLIRSPDDGTSENDTDGPSIIDTSFKNNSSHIQLDSKLHVNSESACDNSPSDKISASQPVGMDNESNVAFVNLTSPLGRKCSSSNHNGSFVLKTPDIEVNNSGSKVESSNLCGDSFVQTKFTTPWITFSRRSKRKRDVNGADTNSTLLLKEKKISCEETDCKGLPVNCATDKLSKNNLDMMIVENMSKDASPIDDLAQGSKISTAIQENHPNRCLQTSLSGAVNDFFGSTIKDKESDNLEFPAGIGKESQVLSSDGVKETLKPVCGREKLTLPCLNLLPSSPDSCGMLDCNSGLDSDSQKNPIHADSESGFDSTNKSHITALQEASPSAMKEAIIERSLKTPLMHNAQVLGSSCSCTEVNATCKENDKASTMFSVDITMKNSPAQPESTACLISEERKLLHGRNNDNQPKQTSNSSSLFIDLSSASPSSFNSSNSREFTHDRVPQYLSNQTSLLRRKLLLNSILCQARDLNGSVGFQQKFNPYTFMWLEEELDSLWIGVRRYGRDWNAILADPRLHFLSWKVPRDLAERWEEEQSKLLHGTNVPQSKYSKPNIMHDAQLSLGNIYTRRPHNLPKPPFSNSRNILNSSIETRIPYSDYQGECYDRMSFNDPQGKATRRGNSNLPHWLKEVVNTHSSPAISPFEHMNKSHDRFGCSKVYDLQHGITKMNEAGPERVSRQDDLIVIDSDASSEDKDDLIVIDSYASSEETISDDNRTILG